MNMMQKRQISLYQNLRVFSINNRAIYSGIFGRFWLNTSWSFGTCSWDQNNVYIGPFIFWKHRALTGWDLVDAGSWHQSIKYVYPMFNKKSDDYYKKNGKGYRFIDDRQVTTDYKDEKKVNIVFENKTDLYCYRIECFARKIQKTFNLKFKFPKNLYKCLFKKKILTLVLKFGIMPR